MGTRTWRKLSARGDTLYRRLLPRLRRYRGRILAIELNSGAYFVGHDELAVAMKAMKQFPGKTFGFYRIGYPAVHKFRGGKKC